MFSKFCLGVNFSSLPEAKFNFPEAKFSFPETKFSFLEARFSFPEAKFNSRGQHDAPSPHVENVVVESSVR